MQVKVTVHETKVEDIRRGMRTRINIQGRELQGNVTSIANQHEQSSFFGGNIKEYATTVKIDGEVTGLKPGMTAEAEILVAHLQNVLTLPISAVAELRGKFHCWVKMPDGEIDRRDLVLGLSNDRFVEVKEGIAEGDQVVRNPRAMIDESREKNVVIEDVNVTEKFGEATSTQPGPAEGGGGAGSSEARGRRGGPSGGGPRGGGGGRGPGGGSMDLMQFDSDGDGKVSKDESPEQMRSFFDRMDGNGDGFIDQDEVDAMRRRFESRDAPSESDGGLRRGPDDGGERGFGGGGSDDGPESGSGQRGGGGGQRDLMQYDADGDGKVSMDEAPERMRGFFDRMDGNGDGFIDANELQEMRSRFSGGGGPRGGE
jgi:hypothetical protein